MIDHRTAQPNQKIRSRRTSPQLERLENRLLMTCSATTTGEWLTDGGGAGHSAYVSGDIGGQFSGELTWVRDIGSSSKAIRDGVLYSVSGQALRATDLLRGHDLWVKQLGAAGPLLGGDVTLSNGNVFFLGRRSGYSVLYSLDAENGEINWTTAISMQFPTSYAPVAANGMLYFQGGYYGGFYGVDQETGEVAFFKNLRANDDWAPAVYDGRLFTWVGGEFAERSPTTGDVLWSYNVEPTPHQSTPPAGPKVVVSEGVALVSAEQFSFESYGLKAIDINTRELLWTADAIDFRHMPAIADGSVFIPYGNTVIERDLRTGQRVNSFEGQLQTYPRSSSQPIVTDDVVINSNRLETVIFDRHSGEVLHELPVSGELSLADNTLVVRSDGKAMVYSLCNAPKPLIWESVTEAKETTPAIKATVSIPDRAAEDLVVALSNSAPELVEVPETVLIAANRTSVEFEVRILDNAYLNRTNDVHITASAPGFTNALPILEIADDEAAVPSSLSEDWKLLQVGQGRSGYVAGKYGTFNPEEPLWQMENSSIALGEEIWVYADSAVNPYTSEVLWKRELPVGRRLIAENELFIFAKDSSNLVVYSFDLRTGEINWISSTLRQFRDHGQVSITEDYLFVPDGSRIFKIDRRTGDLANSIVARAMHSTVTGNKLLVRDGISISAIDLSNDTSLWSDLYKLNGSSDDHGGITISDGRALIKVPSGLRAYEIETGKLLWENEAFFNGQPAADGASIFATRYGSVYELDASNGSVVRILDVGESLTYQPIVTDDAILVSSTSNTVLLDRSDGEIRR